MIKHADTLTLRVATGILQLDTFRRALSTFLRFYETNPTHIQVHLDDYNKMVVDQTLNNYLDPATKTQDVLEGKLGRFLGMQIVAGISEESTLVPGVYTLYSVEPSCALSVQHNRSTEAFA